MLKILSPLFNANEVIITYGIEPFDIVSKYPKLWYYLKNTYIITFIFSNIIYSNLIYSSLFSKKIKKNTANIIPSSNELNLLIGYNPKTNKKIYIPESGLYQNNRLGKN